MRDNQTVAEIDPEVRDLLADFVSRNLPRNETLTPEEVRRASASARGRAVRPNLPVGSVHDMIARQDGIEVAVRHYRPERHSDDEALPTLIYFHGGGWLMGNLDSHDHICRSLVREADIAVIAVDYPLSPETKFPGALLASAAAIRWIFDHAQELGVDPQRVGFGGDSSGGNLAAVLALMARDGELPQPRLQCLIYPVVDLTMAHPSYEISLKGMPLDRAAMDWFIGHYTRTPEDRRDWRASPLLVESVVGVAPAYILTAGVDILRDEAEAYALRLLDAGLAVERRQFPGQIHPFLSLAHALPTAYVALAEIGAYLRNHLR